MQDFENILNTLRQSEAFKSASDADFSQTLIEYLESNYAPQSLSALESEIQRDEKVMTEAEIRDLEAKDKRKVRTDWGDALKSSFLVSFWTTWIVIGVLFAIDIGFMFGAFENSSESIKMLLKARETANISPTVITAMIGATIAQAAAMALAVVGFGFGASKSGS